MADKKITELTTYSPPVDNDVLPIVDTTLGVTMKITWANIKAALKTYFDSLTTTLTNKTLTSPVLTTPQINDTSADHQYITAVSELTADRTVTLPLLTGNDEFVFKDHAQTLTNKTLTSPVINGAITGDAIATGATITTGTANDDIVTSKALADATVGKLGAAWATYTVTPTNLTIGSGTMVGKYIQIGKLVIGKIRIVLAADSSISGTVYLSKPVTSVSTSFPTTEGDCSFLDSGTAEASGRLLSSDTGKFTVQVFNAAGTYLTIAAVNATVPWTWAANDVIDCKFVYEAA